jgi:hypothetical protein
MNCLINGNNLVKTSHTFQLIYLLLTYNQMPIRFTKGSCEITAQSYFYASCEDLLGLRSSLKICDKSADVMNEGNSQNELSNQCLQLSKN